MTAWREGANKLVNLIGTEKCCFSGLSDDLDIWLMPSGYELLGVPESVRLLDEQANSDQASSSMVVKARDKRKPLAIDNSQRSPQPWHSQFEG